MSSTPVAITGKACTFTFGTVAGSAQITTFTVDETADSTTTQTLAGSVTTSKGVEAEVSADFLYDGDETAGGFYAALRAALVAGDPGTLTITAGTTSEWTGSAVVTELSAEAPADDAMTCSATLKVSGSLAFTPGV
jgi:predicted secreted protein